MYALKTTEKTKTDLEEVTMCETNNVLEIKRP